MMLPPPVADLLAAPRHGVLPEAGKRASAGSVAGGCAVELRADAGAVFGFSAYARPEIVAACEWLCRRWHARGSVSAPPAAGELAAELGLSRECLGELLIVLDAAALLAQAVAEDERETGL